MELTYFKNQLTKRQIEELATMDVEKLLQTGEENPLDVQLYFKKIKTYVDKFLSKNENAARDEYQKHGKNVVERFGAEIQHIQGSEIPDYMQDSVYQELYDRLQERKKILDLVYKTGQELYDDEGVKVPKVKTKSIRKDSLTIRL